MPALTTLKHPLSLLLISGLLLNSFLWFLSLFIFPQDHQIAILHYSVGAGIDFIGQEHQIIVLPIAGLFILFSNISIGLAVRQADRVTSWILWSIIPLIQLILILAFFLIWQANH